jgi:quinol monooxygenase YgiN
MVGCTDMGRVGRYVELKAREGQRDELVAHMLGAAHLLADVPGCELYVINTSAADTDTVWVTEVWSTQAELDASLTLDSVKRSVEKVRPLLAGPPERIEILPVGGKGLDVG